MPREKGRKGTNGGRNLETLVKLAAPAIGTAAGAFTVVGIIYLGMTLAGLLRGGGGEIRKAVILYLYPHLVTALAVSGGLGKAEMLGLAQGVETFDSFGVIIKTIAVLITTMMGLVKSGSWAKEILGA